MHESRNGADDSQHVEDGREFGNGVIGTPRELPPVYADMIFHGVLSDIPWGGSVLPSNFVFGKWRDLKKNYLVPLRRLSMAISSAFGDCPNPR